MANILILETDKLLAQSLRQMLEPRGHKLDWQVDPQEAIISADVQKPDLIIMDLLLAGRSGVEFLYEFRSYADWLDVPVIVYSSVPAREVGDSVSGFEQLNISSYLYKPSSSIAALVQQVQQCLPISA